MKGELFITSESGAIGSDDPPETMHMDITADDLTDLKVGNEVVITIKGCVKELGAHRYSGPTMSIEVESKNIRKTGNAQAEGIRKILGEDDDEESEETY